MHLWEFIYSRRWKNKLSQVHFLMNGDGQMQKYHYYENNIEETFTESELKIYFDSCEDLKDQKEQGTTFKSWLNECIRMQIYIPCVEN